MKISVKGIELIKRHEGVRLTAYKCPAGVLTIGYGHTGKDVTVGKVITEAEAEKLLRGDLSTAESEVNKRLSKLNQNQYDALVSFVFNIGIGSFRMSTLLRIAQKTPNDSQIRLEFAKWVRGGGIVLPGLVTRRKEEAELYFSPCKVN
jgi:lysozyme